MTVDEAARILREMYDAGAQGRGLMTTGIHLFGIRYADDLSRLSIKDILSRAGLRPSYPQSSIYVPLSCGSPSTLRSSIGLSPYDNRTYHT